MINCNFHVFLFLETVYYNWLQISETCRKMDSQLFRKKYG